MTLVAVLIPVLGRPWRVEPLLESLRASERAAKLRPLFLVSRGDELEREAVNESGSDWLLMTGPRAPGDYARKINLGATRTVEDGADWVFQAADDVYFCPGWADEAIKVGEESGKAFVGTQDCGNALVRRGRHATHSLIRADYVGRGTMDSTGAVLCELYDHQCVDVEAVETAKHRGEWVFAGESYVEHDHFFWGKSDDDETYRTAMRCGREDIALMQSRQHLWS